MANPVAYPAPGLPETPVLGDLPESGDPPSRPFDGGGVPRYNLFGVGISSINLEDAVSLLVDAPASGCRLRAHFCATHTLVEAASDPDLQRALAEADLVLPDGMPLVWLGRRQGRRVERVCGPDVMLQLLDRSRHRGHSHFFYGGAPEVLGPLVDGLRARFPGLNVAGACSPPFRALSATEKDDVVRLLNGAAPDYVWVGLGSPKQDLWLAEFRPRLNAPVLLAVGAAFDFHAGRLRRAPRWAQRSGLEWTFRLAAEPRRMVGRYASTAWRLSRLLVQSRLRPSLTPTERFAEEC